MPRTLGGDHGHINIKRRDNLVIVDVKTVSEHQHIALLQPFFDSAVIDLALQLVGDEHHDNVRSLSHLISTGHLEPRLGSSFPRLAILQFAHHDLAPAVLKVLGVGMTLATKADDANGLILN
ncbi:hypothetical protein ES703_26764 [subsurface metagenome]